VSHIQNEIIEALVLFQVNRDQSLTYFGLGTWVVMASQDCVGPRNVGPLEKAPQACGIGQVKALPASLQEAAPRRYAPKDFQGSPEPVGELPFGE
jgi:hypothetical protein